MQIETQRLIDLFNSLDPKKADLSYRAEGACQTVALIARHVDDPERLGEAITGAFLRLNQAEKDREGKIRVTNKYAISALAELAEALENFPY